mmetsp:Transcript_64839/g.179801  ORF Transcript_64839/g.179801 Transcript_64839/m.179801 type:complete len:296 (+) Transcript_64839:84-971(+)
MPEIRPSLNGNKIPFPIYLLMASLANGVFLYRSAKDARTAAPGSVSKAGSQLLFGAAISELIWVAPCFVQCFLYIFLESDNFTGNAACHIQGFYSLVSSFSSMLLAPLLSWFTLEFLIADSSKDAGRTKLLCATCLLAATFLGLIPLLPGVPGYVALGEGFCYWDMAAVPVAGFFLVVMILLMGAMFALNGRALYLLGQSGASGTRAKCGTLLALVSSYAVTWILWPVGGILALSGQGFPPGIMIAGGALGHAQALVNPLLYGVLWRSYFLKDSAGESEAGKVPETIITEVAHGA